MLSNFMFLFLTFFLIVTFSSFDGENRRDNIYKAQEPLATITNIQPIAAIEPVQKEEYSPIDDLPYQVLTTEVQFSRGKLVVPKSAKEEIKELFEQARKEGKIRAAKIISWADEHLPAKKKKSLSSAQLKLVEDRNDRLEAYLENLDLRMMIGKISMAERPEVMDSILSKEDKTIRKTFADAELQNLSKSIVMFILKDENK